MKKISLILIIIGIASIRTFAQDATVIYKNTVNSTVTIETDLGLGSGFFVGDGIIVTNYHVIKGATEAYCYTSNSTDKYDIEGYIAVDSSIDLILLKVTRLRRTPIKMSITSVEPGQKIYVIGSPKGLPATISDGIISGLRSFDGYKFIQITAPISHGSSGGPVLNSKGELIGISVAQLEDGQNLNFAIPKSYLKSLLNGAKDLLSYILPYSLSALKGGDNRPSVSSLPDLKKDTAMQDISDLQQIGGDDFSVDQIKYPTVIIGIQEWISENLNICTFRNGDPIPEAKTKKEWLNAGEEGKPAWCYYNNDPANGIKYGRLYNWYAVNDCRGLAPQGWHIPSKDEWEVLSHFLGGSYTKENRTKKLLSEYNSDNFDNPDKGISFNALLGGGERGGYWWGDDFQDTKGTGFWAATVSDESNAYYCPMYTDMEFLWYADYSKSAGFYVRCVKDN